MSDYLHETVLGLEQQVKAMGNSLGEVSASVLQLSVSQPAKVARELEQKIAPMRNKLEDIENSTLPALREVNKHMVEIWTALTGAIAVIGNIEGLQGQIKGLQGQVDALDQRLKTVESQREQAWSRRMTVWTIIIGVAGVLVGAVGALGVYLAFFYPYRP
jgi:chromosome segregation ATPase